MNCKPGDLAVVVAAPYEPEYLGRILEVKSLFDNDAWICEPDLTGHDGRLLAWADAHLRPIRDPGDDAVDESKAWLPPVPSEVTA